jgi:putative chitinase
MSTDFNLTEEQLSQIIPNNSYIKEWLEALLKYLPNYDINTVNRAAAFLAQCVHESNGFTTLKENLNYKWESLRRVFPKYFPTDELAQHYSHHQEDIANRVYANRMGNGDEISGDGWKFCGHGLIQLTGRNNYKILSDDIGMDINDLPDYLVTFDGAVHSACCFWKNNNLNRYADSSDILTMTKRINGGTLGLSERIDLYKKIIEILRT